MSTATERHDTHLSEDRLATAPLPDPTVPTSCATGGALLGAAATVVAALWVSNEVPLVTAVMATAMAIVMLGVPGFLMLTWRRYSLLYESGVVLDIQSGVFGDRVFSEHVRRLVITPGSRVERLGVAGKAFGVRVETFVEGHVGTAGAQPHWILWGPLRTESEAVAITDLVARIQAGISDRSAAHRGVRAGDES